MRNVRKTEHQIRIEHFMLKAEQELPQSPCIPSEEVRRLRAQLILEEALETIYALGVGLRYEAKLFFDDALKFTTRDSKDKSYSVDLVKIADGCADLSVVTIGTLSACGIADEALLEEVDRSNLDKFRGDAHKAGPEHPQPGRWCKPSDWKPPEIERILAEQWPGEGWIWDGEQWVTDVTALNVDEKWTPPAEVYEQNGHGWAEVTETDYLPRCPNGCEGYLGSDGYCQVCGLTNRLKPFKSIEEYRASMKAAGRFVNDSYDRLCSNCGRVPIHKLNTGGVCADCISDKAVKEAKRV